MKVSRDQAAKNRSNIVTIAAEKFRERGYDGIGIVELMRAAGLTHGGFYKRFAGKDALMQEATSVALAANLGHWRTAIARDPKNAAAALRRWYLDPRHLTVIGDGCTYAALAGEAPRCGPEIRRTFQTFLQASIEEVRDDNPDTAESRAEAIRGIAQMIGALLLARAVEDREFANEILSSAKTR